MAKIDWKEDVKYSIRGRVVTMNGESKTHDDGIIYIEGDTIVHVQNANLTAPDG